MGLTTDQFFADDTLINDMMGELEKCIELSGLNNPVIYEPCNGDGRISKTIKQKYPHLKLFTNDLDPKMAALYKGTMNEDMNAVDWRESFRTIGVDTDEMIVCTGVPYGSVKNGDKGLAIKCINSIVDYCKYAALIVPASFKYMHMINQIDRRWKIYSTKLVHKNAFRKPNEPGKFDVSSTILILYNDGGLRPIYNLEKQHDDFTVYCGKTNHPCTEEYDFVIMQKSENIKIWDGVEGNLRAQVLSNGKKRVKQYAGYMFVKVHTMDKFLRTIEEFTWPILTQNQIGSHYLSEHSLNVAHEFINYNKHEEYINLISNNA